VGVAGYETKDRGRMGAEEKHPMSNIPRGLSISSFTENACERTLLTGFLFVWTTRCLSLPCHCTYGYRMLRRAEEHYVVDADTYPEQ